MAEKSTNYHHCIQLEKVIKSILYTEVNSFGGITAILTYAIPELQEYEEEIEEPKESTEDAEEEDIESKMALMQLGDHNDEGSDDEDDDDNWGLEANNSNPNSLKGKTKLNKHDLKERDLERKKIQTRKLSKMDDEDDF